jgi:hypothetical protein
VVSDIPIEFEVRGMQTFKFNIPIQIPVNINTDKGDTFEVALTFYGPKGNTFGQIINMKIKVINSIAAQEKLFKTAITMSECDIASFDDCVEALKKFKGDENAAC